MRPNGKRHRTIAAPFGKGMWSAGDPSNLPDGFVPSVRNYLVRPDGSGARFAGRPPFVYDSLDTVSGFATWLDLVNEVTHPVAIRSSDAKIYTKNSTGQGYTAGVATGLSSTRLTSSTNFLGKLHMMFDNGSGVPSAAASWDGTTVVTTPFNTTAIYSRAIQTFVDRLFLAYPRLTVVNGFSVAQAYDFSNWSGATHSAGVLYTKNFVASGTTVCRLYADAWGPNAGFANLSSNAKFVWRQDLRGVDGLHQQPFTMQAYLRAPWSLTTAYAVGDLINDCNNDLLFIANGNSPLGHIQRCTTAGTSSGAVPTFATTTGSTTVDNTVTWTCEGPAVFSSLEGFVPSATASGDWSTFYLPISGPTTNPSGIGVKLGCALVLYNSTDNSSHYAVDVSYKDAITDGDARKANRGAQLTSGDFYFPFFNQESSVTATVNIDALIWSEINDPKRILAKNTYPLQEIAGLPTAMIVCNGRLVVFKRKGMWIFRGQADINEPILPETNALHFGCLGPQALDVSRDGQLYWIGPQHVYRMNIGTDSTPTEIDSPGMFEEIMSRGSNWVESQATYNMPLLAIDHTNKDVWIYTQKGKIYVYNIPTQAWSYIDTNPTGTSAEVNGIMFDQVYNRMLVSFGGQSATRFDETSDASDTIITGGGTSWNIANDLVLKPFELFAPRYEASLLEIGLFHLATIQNGSLSVSYSIDRGSTYTTPTGYPVSTWLTNPRIVLPVTITGPSITIKLSRTGAGGARNWTISKCDSLLRVHRGELPTVNAS